MVLVTLTVAVLGWITGQYRDIAFMTLILILVSATMLTFLILNIHEHRLQARRWGEHQGQRGHKRDKAEISGKVDVAPGSKAWRGTLAFSFPFEQIIHGDSNNNHPKGDGRLNRPLQESQHQDYHRKNDKQQLWNRVPGGF